MKASAVRDSQRADVEIDQISIDYICEVFYNWTEGHVNCDIVFPWLEYHIVPDLLQFELIHESTQQVIDIVLLYGPDKMVGLDCHLKWSPLSMINC